MRAAAFGLTLTAMLLPAFMGPAAVAAPDPGAFDGTWDVLALCPAENGALGYNLRFTAEVKAGVLHGLYGTEGKASSMTLDGTIQPDGTATFAAKGLTGETFYTNAKPATPYGYDVTATFKGSRGSGTRVGGTRTCNYTFVRH